MVKKREVIEKEFFTEITIWMGKDFAVLLVTNITKFYMFS
tara:strand:- start:179 stop:298 length:120 start_codon:yes stop_codon:yes gene_type:complete